ncbi:MAG: Smr/MutS family protein [Bacteroidota bacterium]|nr:Smr/MutS family protein [Bacteroidota bacterium]
MLYPENIEAKLNFEIIRDYLADKCRSGESVKMCRDFRFMNRFQSIVHKLKLTEEMKNILQFEDSFPSGFFPDSGEMFSQKEQAGSYFKESELMELKASLENVKRLSGFFKSKKTKNYPELEGLLPAIDFAGYIIMEVSSIIDRNGEIKDSASPELRKIRNDLTVKRSSISKTLSRIIAQSEKAGIVDSDAKPTMREGKLLIPVNSSDKRKIKGVVYDVSASGRTSYIEPLEVMDLNNDIKALEIAEKQEMVRILTEITVDFRPYFPRILKSYRFLFELDFITAKAKLAIDIHGLMPDVYEKPFTKFRNAGHPLLLLAYKRNQEKEVVRSDIFLHENKRLMMISGPNAGGKSVTLKTTGMLQYMLQCGLLIPVKRVSEVGIYQSIFMDIGDEQSVENDLSTYSSHLLNMKHFTRRADSKSLVLIDEMGSGTEPHLGGAIAEAVLEELVHRKVRGVITTHYANLKAFAENTEGVFNAAMLFDRKNLKPLYKLEPGSPGSSFAFEIAQKTGLSHKILKSAKSKTDSSQLDFEQILKKTLKEKRQLRETKQKVKQEEKEISALKARYEKGAEFVFTEKKRLLKEAKAEAQLILDEANKKIENTIFEIRKQQADKESTKQLRSQLEHFKKELEEDVSSREEKLAKRIKKVSHKKEKQKEKVIKLAGVGDSVKIKGQTTTADVLQIKGKNAVVAVGSMKMTVKRADLTVTKSVKKKESSSTVNLIQDDSKIESSSLYGIDIRGKRADESEQLVLQYIDSSILSRTKHLKILHGTGNGILRQVVREVLGKHNQVKNFKDERIEAGGHGITVVELKL